MRINVVPVLSLPHQPPCYPEELGVSYPPYPAGYSFNNFHPSLYLVCFTDLMQGMAVRWTLIYSIENLFDDFELKLVL